MTVHDPPLPVLEAIQASAPVFMCETDLACLWTVTRTGGPGVLKVYHALEMGDEAPGFDLLDQLNGHGAAELYARAENYAVIELLDGPSLGDLTRDGRDLEAADALADVALAIHGCEMDHATLTPLDTWCDALLGHAVDAACPAALRRDLDAARNICRERLQAPFTPRPLHGDLHHDNVRRGPRGWCAFDAKGLVGDPAFDLANAYRNPVGAETLMRQPGRIRAYTDHWSARLGVPQNILLDWAVVQCALSMAWRAGGPIGLDQDADLLSVLLSLARPA